MVVWSNRAVFQLARNGTTTHTVDPTSATGLVSGATFTPTTGSFLVVVMEGSVTSSTPSGWTLPSGGSAVNNTGLYVWHRVAAAGSNSFTTTHNASNYPVVVAVYEFPAGSTFVGSVAGTGISFAGANTNLTGLTGTNLVVGVVATGATSGSGTASVAWSGTGSPVEDFDLFALASGTDGYVMSLASVEAFAGSSWQPTGVITESLTSLSNKEALTFAVSVAASGSNAGTMSASVPVVTAAFTGQSVNTGTLSAATPKVTGALTGQSVNAGSLAASTPKATAAVAGASVNTGSLAGEAPKVAASITGQSVNAGSLNAATPTITASVAGASVNAGTLAGAVPRVVASIADQATVTGTLAGATPKVTAALTGTAKNTGTLAAVAPKLTASIADTTANPGTLTAAAPRLTAQISGVSVNVGTLAGSVPRVSAGIAGQLVNVGVLEAVAPVVLSALTAAQFIPGALAGVLPLLRFENAPSGAAADYSLEVGGVDRSGFAVISSAWQAFTPGPVSRSSFKVERVSL